MLPRIKTKTSLIAPGLKNALMILLFDNGWLFTLKKTFRRITMYVISNVFKDTYSCIFTIIR